MRLYKDTAIFSSEKFFSRVCDYLTTENTEFLYFECHYCFVRKEIKALFLLFSRTISLIMISFYKYSAPLVLFLLPSPFLFPLSLFPNDFFPDLISA